MELKMNKIIDEGVLYEDNEDEEEEEDEFEFGESEAEELEEMLYVRPARTGEEDEEGMLVSEEEAAEEGQVFVPRVKLQAYMMNEGANLRTKKNEGKKFTKGTDPRNKDVVNFMADENINCP